MPFDRARTPGHSESGGDGVEIAVDASGEGVEAGQVVLPDGVEPGWQVFTLALREHDREGADMPGEGVELGTVRVESLELDLFGLGEGLRSAEDPPGDGPG